MSLKETKTGQDGGTHPERAVLQTAVRRDALEWERLLTDKMDLFVEPLDVFLKTFEVTTLLVVRSDGIARGQRNQHHRWGVNEIDELTGP